MALCGERWVMGVGHSDVVNGGGWVWGLGTGVGLRDGCRA